MTDSTLRMHSSTFVQLLKVLAIKLDGQSNSTFDGRRVVIDDNVPPELVLSTLVERQDKEIEALKAENDRLRGVICDQLTAEAQKNGEY